MKSWKILSLVLALMLVLVSAALAEPVAPPTQGDNIENVETGDNSQKCAHSETREVIAQYPTCEATGLREYICTTCKEVVDAAVIPKLGHDMKLAETVNATCTKEGYKLYKCANTGCDHTETEAIAKVAHNLEKVHVAPTCTEDGYDLYKCINEGCDYTEKQTIKAPGHDWHFIRVVEPAACEKAGYTLEKCLMCEEYRTVDVAPLQHNWVLTSHQDATCTEDGYDHYTCSICAGEKTDVINALGHAWTAWAIDEKPLCEQAGLKSRYCTRACCYEPNLLKTVKETEVIPAHGHKIDEARAIIVPATETSEGSKTGTCVYCSKKVVETIPMIVPEPTEKPSEEPTVEPTDKPDSKPTQKPINDGNKPSTSGSGVVIPATGDQSITWAYLMMAMAVIGLVVLKKRSAQHN